MRTPERIEFRRRSVLRWLPERQPPDPQNNGELAQKLLSGISHKDLRFLAKQLGIAGAGRMKKDELIEKIITAGGR